LIRIKTRSGQGNALISILFLIGFEPLKKLIATKFPEMMYVTRKGVTVDPLLFADDNLSLTKLQQIEQLDLFLAMYDCYTGVSGLNIIVSKLSALYIICRTILFMIFNKEASRGFTTHDTMRRLGIELGKNH
jgi:hypothetical protein